MNIARPMIKVCKKCNQSKSLDAFHNDKNRTDGKYPNCKECHSFYIRNRYKNDENARKVHLERAKKLNRNSEKFREEAKARSFKFYQSLNGRAKTLFNSAKKSPASKLYEFSLTLEHVEKLLKIGVCPITGINFDFSNDHQIAFNRKKNPYSPSIDRIDSRKGYTNENTRIVIWQFNMMKGELTDGEIFFLCERILRNRKNEP